MAWFKDGRVQNRIIDFLSTSKDTRGKISRRFRLPSPWNIGVVLRLLWLCGAHGREDRSYSVSQISFRHKTLWCHGEGGNPLQCQPTSSKTLEQVHDISISRIPYAVPPLRPSAKPVLTHVLNQSRMARHYAKINITDAPFIH